MADATLTIVDGRASLQPFGSDAILPLVTAAASSATLSQEWADASAASAALSETSAKQSVTYQSAVKRAADRGVTSGDGVSLMAARGVILDFLSAVYRWGAAISDRTSALAKITTSRASIAYGLNAAGKWQQFAIDTARVTDAGLTVEGAATQLAQFPNATTWGTSNGGAYTITTTTGIDPAIDADGTYKGTKRTSAHSLAQGIVVASITNSSLAAGTYVYSIILKKGTSNFNRIICDGGAAQSPEWSIDWSGGKPVLASISGIGNSASVDTINEAEGIYRINLITVRTSSAPMRVVYNHTDTLGGSPSAIGVGNDLGTFWHHDVYLASAPSSPIFTSGATRSADVMSLALPAGAASDRITVTWVGGAKTFSRSELASSTTLDLISDLGAPWAGKTITSIVMVAKNDTTLLEPTANLGTTPWLVVKNGTIWANGVAYATLADMLAGIGDANTITGTNLTTMVLGGYVAPDAVDWCSEDFTVDLSGFYTSAGAAGPLVSGGYLVFGPTTNIGISIVKPVRVPTGKAYQLSLTGKRGTSTNSFRAGAGSYNDSLGIGNFGNDISGTVDSVSTVDVSVNNLNNANGLLWIGVQRPFGGQSGGQTLMFKNVTLKEKAPAKGFPNGAWWQEMEVTIPATIPWEGSFTGSISGTTMTVTGLVGVLNAGDLVRGTGVTAGTTLVSNNGDGTWEVSPSQTVASTAMEFATPSFVSCVIANYSCGTTIDYVELQLRANGDVFLFSRINDGYTGSFDTSLKIGTVVAGETTKIAFGQTLGFLRGSVKGLVGEAECDNGVTFTYCRNGARLNGSKPFTGTINSMMLYSGCETADYMALRTAGNVVRKAVIVGDSYSAMASSGNGRFLAEQGIQTLSFGSGGLTFAQEYTIATGADFIAAARDAVAIWMDGDPNGRTAACSFTGSIDGNVLTVSAVASGALAVNHVINNSAMDVGEDGVILAQLTGTPGGVGTYRLAKSMTLTSRALTSYDEVAKYVTWVAALGHNRHLYYRSGRIGPQRTVGSTTLVTATNRDAQDMGTVWRRIQQLYGTARVYDAWPEQCALSVAARDPSNVQYAAANSDIQYGFFPRDTLVDGVHQTAAVRSALAPGLAAKVRAVAAL